MNKIKKILIVIAGSILLCLPLITSFFQKIGSYKLFSFNWVITGYQSTYSVYDYSFEIRVPSDGRYSLAYEIVITAENESGENRTIHDYHSTTVDVTDGEKIYLVDSSHNTTSVRYGEKIASIKVANVSVVKENDGNWSVGYAIGFGIVSGAALVGLIVVFVMDKSGKQNSNDVN